MNQTKKASHRPKVVVMGGGTGLSVILKALKYKKVDITAIVAVSDDGGSSGKLRQAAEQIPPGDLRNCIAALSELPAEDLELFQYRFQDRVDELSGHSLGNLIIAALGEMYSNYYLAISRLCEMMAVKGQVLPAAETPLTLCANFEDGTLMEGESKITQQDKRIKRVSLKGPEGDQPIQAGTGVLEAIATADEIVLGPGSLYTSILPNLLIEDISQAVINAHAEVMYICNIMTQKGETENFSDADHIDVLSNHVGCQFIDKVLVNNALVPKEIYQHPSQDEDLMQVKCDFTTLSQRVNTIISDDFLNIVDGRVYHNAEKVADEIERAAYSRSQETQHN